MTIVFSAVSHDLIVMSVDSAVTLDFEDSRREYDTGRKSFLYPGVGCVATWGARDGNQIGIFLDKQGLSPENHSVVDLANLVFEYLTEEYQPRECGLDDVGFHVAGFDQEERPRFSHIFWGFDRPRPDEQVEPKYERYDHSPTPGNPEYIYNGRNDLAHVMVVTLLDQIRAGNATQFDPRKREGLVRLGDFVVRFAGELTPEVGPPFITYLISPHNQAVSIKNNTLCPISQNKVLRKLGDLGYEIQTESISHTFTNQGTS